MYTFQRPCPQEFPIPFPIIKYFFTNPSSPKGWKKLIQTCKYFFFKNPVFPVECIHERTLFHTTKEWKANGKILNAKKGTIKYWCFGTLYSPTEFPKGLSLLIPKIYKFSLQVLTVVEQTLTFEEYQILTSSDSLETLNLFENTIIKNSDGTMVTADKLIEKKYNLRRIELNCSNDFFKQDTVNRLVKILPNFKKLQYFNMYYLTESFDINLFLNFVFKIETSTTFRISYGVVLSEDYRKMLEACIDKMIANPPEKIPIIWFSEFKGERYRKYSSLTRLRSG